jgi:hypothetical protein
MIVCVFLGGGEIRLRPSPQKDFSKLLFAEQWPGLLVAALFSLICKINAIHASGNEF